MTATDYEIALARNKSYTGTAIFVFFLYCFFFFPGYIANFLFIQDADRMEKKAKTSLPGVNILKAMFYITTTALVLSACIVGYALYSVS